MKIIKLHTIDSTSSFLKELSKSEALKNYTTVVANKQFSGRGQRDNKWVSEESKNLLFSSLINFSEIKIAEQRYLNFAISLAIFDILTAYKIPKLQIKWPNDILSGDKKIVGILIENSIKNHLITSSIIGIGLNVNQKKFPKELSEAISMISFLKKEISLALLLQELLLSIKKQITRLEKKQFKELERDYLAVLYKKNIPTMFKNRQNILFMGVIKGVSKNGLLQVLLEDNSIKEFDIKEISFA